MDTTTSKRYKVTVSEQHEFSFSADDLKGLDWDGQSGGLHHLLYENGSYKIQSQSIDTRDNVYQLQINGKEFTVRILEPLDLLIEEMGFAAQNNAAKLEVASPMPGLILDLKAKEGDSVSEGEPLLILEAMKMENVIGAPLSGTISKIMVAKGDSVEKNQLLIQFKEEG